MMGGKEQFIGTWPAVQEGRYNSEAKDSYQYNIREYNDRVKVRFQHLFNLPIIQ